ncbi:MAG: error-prone DNA polymerase [Myxococcota bacterium]|nr:error-prone DNA polymerase [Myxococcota bacterium]MDW8362070.1 error-prone DNA polymerase [Myxococcales bacterium]
MNRAPPYVPLRVRTCGSMLEGASHPEQIVERAHALGLPAVAITDLEGVYGLPRAHVRATELGLPLLAGAEVRLDEGGSVVLLAASRRGWANLCRLLTAGRLRAPKGHCRLALTDVLAHEQGLLALTDTASLLPPLRDAFGDRLWALLGRHLAPGERLRERLLREAARRTGVPLVAALEVLYHDRARRPLHDVLRCIRTGTTLASAGRRLPPNGEHALASAARMAARYADEPDALARTLEVAARASFSLCDLKYKYPAARLPDGTPETDQLRALVAQGAARRYPSGVPADVQAQIERELALIAELEVGGYFLGMHEIVEFCRQQGILCQGRGSAANSVVCYCLGITAIDPVRMDLLFERFLSRERAEPPDIDLDVEHGRREEVIRHLYARYGPRHAAMVASVVRYRIRSAVRDVGKVLGLPAVTVDRLARLLSHEECALEPALLTAAGLDPNAPATHALVARVHELLELPRHLSIHPGGFLLGHEPVDELVPIERAAMAGRTVIQWDKYDVEALGLFKVDILGLGALTAVHRAFDLLEAHEGRRLEMATVPAEDPATYAMCRRADTIGVFQIESRAQMAMAPRLQPRTFHDLVVQIALVRPGPIQGDMVHPYLRRRRGLEPVELPHPSLERVLGRTLGVPIFQEQVMRLAMVAAGYSGGEADQLRRDMASWRSAGRMERHRARLVEGMVARGIDRAFAERVFAQIRGFGEYGFPESHAASFALIAYVTAWLRCHHLAIFGAALLDAQPMGFYPVATIVHDLRRHGVAVRPIDVQRSGWHSRLEPADPGERPPWALRLGLRHVRGLGEAARERLQRAAPPYASLEDFVRRTGLDLAALLALARAGAFDGFGLDRRRALWAVRALRRGTRDPLPLCDASSRARFAALDPHALVAWDYRATGLSCRGHPLERWRRALTARGLPTAAELETMPHGCAVAYVGAVVVRQRPATARGVTFYTLEDETGLVNVVVRQNVFERDAAVARTAWLLGVRGRIEAAEGVRHLVADALFAPRRDLLEPEARPETRDFR